MIEILTDRPEGTLEARPGVPFSGSRAVFEGGVLVARTRVRAGRLWKDSGTVRVGAAAYDVVQEGSAFGTERRYVLRGRDVAEGAVAARASHERWLVGLPWRLDSGPVVLEHGGRSYRGENPAFGAFYFREEGRGAPVGWVRREGAFSRAIVADLPSGWPPEVRAFALWLAEIAWQFGRGAGSPSGGTPGT